MGNPVVHFEIGCRDRDNTEQFYKLLFDWNITPHGPFSLKIDTGSDQGIGGHITALGHEPHQYVMFYVEVEKIENTLEQLEKLGGSVFIPATEIPTGGRFAWCKDPGGNTFGLVENAG